MGVNGYFADILNDAPALLVPLDDASGTTATAMAGSNGTYTNGPVLGVAGPDAVGSTGVTLDGTNDHVVLDASSLSMFLTDPFTMEAWVKFTSTATMTVMSVSHTSNTDYYMELGVSSGDVYGLARQGGGASYVWGTTNINDGAWHHIAITVVGTTITVFVDGVQEGSGASGSRPSSLNAARIGHLHRHTGQIGHFAGSVAAAAYYASELTDAQIAAHNAGGLWAQGSTSPMVLG